jgi:hypothetical protein
MSLRLSVEESRQSRIVYTPDSKTFLALDQQNKIKACMSVSAIQFNLYTLSFSFDRGFTLIDNSFPGEACKDTKKIRS